MSDDPYIYPGTRTLRNKLGIRQSALLDYHEREIVMMRARQGIPSGNFDLKHLKTIHLHLFQDVFDWAGELRTVEISKGGSQFQFRQFIETGMADVHRRLAVADFLRGLSPAEFAEGAAKIIGDVNYVHPFREGNGRTQMYYLKQLAEQATHPIDLTRIDAEGWLEASKASHRGDYGFIAELIASAFKSE